MPPASRLHIQPSAMPARQAASTSRTIALDGEYPPFKSASSAPSSVRPAICAVIAPTSSVNCAWVIHYLLFRALALAADISERYLAQLEAGDGNASVVLLRRVATALGLPLRELVGDNESPVEQRLIRRFFERLPAHRLEDVILQLMRDFGQKEAARKNRIALVGLRGAGKSTLGAAIAKE